MHVPNPRLRTAKSKMGKALAVLLLLGILPTPALATEPVAEETPKAVTWQFPVKKQADARVATTTPRPRKVAKGAFPTWKKVDFTIESRWFNGGDEIKIDEIWSALGTLTKGDIVRVKGTYTLASQKHARLSFSIARDAAADPDDLHTVGEPIQAGSVPFELKLSIAVDDQPDIGFQDGRPHVGFYDIETQQSFGWIYIGLPDTALDLPTDPETEKLLRTMDKVDWVIGPYYFARGDRITVQEVQSRLGTFTKGDTVLVRGTYTLASRKAGSMLFSLTLTRKNSGGREIYSRNRQTLRAGTVPFELVKHVTDDEAYFHLSLRSIKSGGSFGCLYFGTQQQMQEIADWDVEKWQERGR